MRVYKIGYWHDSSTFHDDGYIFAQNEKEALEYTQKMADGLAMCEVKHIQSIYQLASPKVIDFLLKKRNLF